MENRICRVRKNVEYNIWCGWKNMVKPHVKCRKNIQKTPKKNNYLCTINQVCDIIKTTKY